MKQILDHSGYTEENNKVISGCFAMVGTPCVYGSKYKEEVLKRFDQFFPQENELPKSVEEISDKSNLNT